MKWKLLITIVLSLLLGYLSSEAVAFQYNWAYQTTKTLLQAKEVDWSIITGELRANLVNVPLISTGLFFGYLRSFFQGPKWWRFLALLCYFSVVARNILSCLNDWGFLDWSQLRETTSSIIAVGPTFYCAPYSFPLSFFKIALEIILFYAAVKLGEYIRNSLTVLKKPSAQMLPGSVALFSIGILEFSSKACHYQASWKMQLATQFVLLLVASSLTYARYYSPQTASVLRAIVFTSMPVLVFAFSYLIFALNGLTTNPLIAVLAITAIFLTTLIATSSGALLGSFLIRKKIHER